MDEQSKESLEQEIKNAEGVINKLQNFANELVKTSDNNILTHLCDGLQTFLGYDKTSKGYDGSGIVYSDLDRLCDGVMGFLSGVLGAVKNTQTYNAGKNTLNLVSNVINNHLCSGHDGFKKLLPSLTRGIEKYNREVRESNEKVKKPIMELLNQVGDAFTQKVQHILSQENERDDPEKVKAAEKLIRQQLEACQKHATQFTGTFKITNKIENTDMKIVISHFNSTLQPRVNSALKAVCHDKQRLEQLSATENTNLNKMLGLITTKLGGIKTSVIEQINVNVKQLVSDLKGLVGNIILRDLKKIDRQLVQYVEDLQEWIDTSDKIVDNTVDEIGYIIREGPGKNSQRALESIASSVDLWKDKMVEYIKSVTTLTAQIHGKIVDLGKAFPKEQSGRETGEPRKTIHEVFDHLRTTVAQIKGSRNAFYMGFEGIEEAVKKYAEGFGKEQFETKALSRWIGEILDNNEVVRGWIEGYGETAMTSFQTPYNGRGKLKDPGLTKKIASCIMSGIGYAINAAQLQISAAGLDVAKNINAVNAVCGAFSTKLSEFINPDAEQRSFIEEIARAIDDSFRRAAVPPSGADRNGYLERAVRCMLQQLVGAARGASAELHSLTLEQRSTASGTSVAGKMSEAHVKAKNLLNQLTVATGAQRGTQYSDLLDDAVNQAAKKAAELNADYMTGIFAGWSKQIKDNLSDLLKAFTHTGKNIKQQLTQLKDTISKGAPSKGLQQIHHHLRQLQNVTVAKAIKEADDILKIHAPTLQAKYLKELTSYVEEKVTDAQNALTHEARKRYVCDVKGLLTEFSKKVVTELQKLPDAIANDLDKGLKGFMKKFGEHFVNKIADIVSISPKDFTPKSPISPASLKLKNALSELIHALKDQTDFKSDMKKISLVHDALNKLLSGLVISQCYDHTFSDNLNAFRSAFEGFNASKFGEPTTALTQALKEGLNGLTKELGKAYVNRYSGLKYDASHADKYAKVVSTIFYTLHENLHTLNKKCMRGGEWADKKLCEKDNRKANALGSFLKRCGFKIGKDENSKDCELQFPSFNFTGQHLNQKLFAREYVDDEVAHLVDCGSNKQRKPHGFDIIDLINCLLHHLEKYNEICYISTASSTKVPCSIHDMLVWFSGLPYSSAYSTVLRDSIMELLTDKDKQKSKVHDGLEFTVMDPASLSITAHPSDITYERVDKALSHICSMSYDIVTAIAGHGDAQTIYGSDYCNNSFKFTYPATGDDCFHAILDTLRRMLPTLRYMYMKCRIGSQYDGWADCFYGKDVSTTKSQCNKHSRSEPNCQPTSPLMSYLYDSLPGHLPHDLSSIGCKRKCNTCPKSTPGMPCLTPLGFRSFSGRNRLGGELCYILERCVTYTDLSCIFAILPRPPSTLPEHFGFALSLATGLNTPRPRIKPIQPSFHESFVSAISDTSLNLDDTDGDIIADLTSAYSSTSSTHTKCKDSHLLHLTSNVCANNNIYCAPYLYTLCHDHYEYVANRHAKLYLSWAIYLSWTLWKCLKNLYDDFCSIVCADWGCHGCINSKTCKKGNHGASISSCNCPSLVKCGAVSPTLYKQGFTFGDAEKLNAVHTRRTCFSFQHQLNKILKSQYFTDLFETCDNFLFAIRAPFIWLNVALWFLSLLYLLHIMVIRLDLLHIKSHLHSPSSHRIAAQSLLAAARVNKLSRVFYLQP